MFTVKSPSFVFSQRLQSEIARVSCVRPDRQVEVSSVDYTTGFPVPIHPSSPSQRVRSSDKFEIPEKPSLKIKNEGLVSPVFRMAPYLAEEKRREGDMTVANILFLDEGNECRSILGAGIMKKLVVESGLEEDVSISAGSIGLPCRNELSTELLQVASEMDINLDAELNQGRVFNEATDAIDNDLILVMDRFDREEVYKDISVLDTIHPTGYYSSRLKLLGEFSFVSRGVDLDMDLMEIGDPWYGNVESQKGFEALRVVGRKLLMSCKGLLTYLQMLKIKCKHGLSMQSALTQSLRCPVMEQSSLSRSIRMKNWKPIWKSKDFSEDGFFTVEGMGNELRVVKKSMSQRKKRNYWNDVENVEYEIRTWMWRHQISSRLPKHQELRESGHTGLSRAIVLHGGMQAFSKRMGLPGYFTKKRKPYGYWKDLKNVEKEMNEWMEKYGNGDEFPTRDRLRSTGAYDLSTALRYYGGNEVLSKHFKKKSRHGRKYWENDTNFINEILPFIETDKDGQLYLPRQQDLLSCKRADLLGAIIRRGGYREVAVFLGVRSRKKTSRNFRGFVEDLLMFLNKLSLPKEHLPSQWCLECKGRSDLVQEIKCFGGSRAVAKKLGWSYDL